MSRQDDAFPAGRAALYGLYLRHVEGLAPDEAAALVIERYPQTRPLLERLIRPPVVDPLESNVQRNGGGEKDRWNQYSK